MPAVTTVFHSTLNIYIDFFRYIKFSEINSFMIDRSKVLMFV